MFEKLYSGRNYNAPLKDKTTATKAEIILKYLKPRSRIFVPGCGPCFEGKAFMRAGHHVTAVDVSGRFGNIAKKNSNEFRRADVTKALGFKSDSFDAIVAFELIEHLGFIDGFLGECSRVLKKGGLLILSTPSQSYWKTRVGLFFGKDVLSDFHPRTFTPQSLAQKLEKYFRVEKMIGVGKLGFLLSTKIPALSLCGDFIVIARKR